jgi:hypothetical protein
VHSEEDVQATRDALMESIAELAAAAPN